MINKHLLKSWFALSLTVIAFVMFMPIFANKLLNSNDSKNFENNYFVLGSYSLVYKISGMVPPHIKLHKYYVSLRETNIYLIIKPIERRNSYAILNVTLTVKGAGIVWHEDKSKIIDLTYEKSVLIRCDLSNGKTWINNAFVGYSPFSPLIANNTLIYNAWIHNIGSVEINYSLIDVTMFKISESVLDLKDGYIEAIDYLRNKTIREKIPSELLKQLKIHRKLCEIFKMRKLKISTYRFINKRYLNSIMLISIEENLKLPIFIQMPGGVVETVKHGYYGDAKWVLVSPIAYNLGIGSMIFSLQLVDIETSE